MRNIYLATSIAFTLTFIIGITTMNHTLGLTLSDVVITSAESGIFAGLFMWFIGE